MAFQNILQSAKKFFGPDNSFFHGTAEKYDPQPQPDMQAPMPQQDMNAPQMDAQMAYQQQYAPQQGYQPQPYQQPQMPQQPMDYQQQYAQAPYQQPQQPMQQPVQQQPEQPFQQGYRPPQQQTVNEPYVAPRNRRSAQHQQAQQQMQPMQQEGQIPGNVVNFPGSAPQQPQQQPQQKLPNTCVINTRSMADCRNAIGILRAGDCVIAVMDTLTDQTELRRYVDTLNGACFSLGCTMTRLATRVGVYLLAPAAIKVYTDQATTQMNGMNRAPQRPQRSAPAVQQPFQAPYQQPQMMQQGYQHAAYQQPAPQQQMPYQQPYQQPQQMAQPAFSAQAPAQGYAPDQPEAEYNAI